MKLFSGFIIYSFVVFLVSCKGKTEKKEEPGNSKYKNHISLEAKGFKIKDAYLVFDDSTKLSDDNMTTIGKHVNLILLIDSGWTVEDGKIYAGIGEKVESNDGKHVFDEPDLMSTHGPVPAADGSQVTIQAVINTVDKQYDYFLVSFHVWDKKSDAEITGSYKLHFKL